MLPSFPDQFTRARHSRATSVIALIIAIGGHLILLHALDHPREATPLRHPITSINVISKATLAAHPRTNKHSHTTLEEKENISQIETQKPTEISQATDEQAVTGGSYYFTSDELSEKPLVIADLASEFSLPEIPGLPQPLAMTLRISANGNVDDAVINSAINDEKASQLIIDAFKQMKFEAAKIDTIPVPSEIHIEVWGNAEFQ